MSEMMENKYENIKTEIEKTLKEILCIEDNSISIKCEINEQGRKLIFIKGVGDKKGIIEKINLKPIPNILDTTLVKFENIEFVENFIAMLVLTLFSDRYHFSYTDEEFKIFVDYVTKSNFVVSPSVIFKGCNFNFNKDDKILFSNIDINFLSFIECTFCGKLFFYNMNFKIGVELLRCNYENYITFQNIIFSDFPNIQTQNKDLKINFYAVTFKNDIDIYLLDVKDIKEISFNLVIFKGEFRFSNQFGLDVKISKIKAKLNFNEVEFEKGTKIIDTQFCGGIRFKKVTFHKQVSFDNSIIFENKLNLSYMVFKDSATLKGILLENVSVNIEHVIAKEGFSLSNIYELKKNGMPYRIDISSVKLQKNIFIYNSQFNKQFKLCDYICDGDVCIESCSFDDVFFTNATFNKNFDFKGNIVKGHTSFLNSKINCISNFSSTIFDNTIDCNMSYFDKIPNIFSSCFGAGSSLSLSGARLSVNSIEDIKYGFLDFKNKNTNTLNQIEIIKGMRECLKIFKDALLKTNNILEASKYKVLELYAKEVELDYKLEHKKELEEKITIKEQFDRWFLKLNRATSDHHTDFLKILLFTLSVIGGYFMINFGLSLEIVASNFDYLVGKAQPIENYTKMVFNSFDLKNFAFSTLCVLCFIVYITLVLAFSKFKKLLGILGAVGIIGILCSPNIITPFLGAFSEDARNHYLYKAIDELDSQKALELSRQILAKEPTSELNAKKILKDYKDELKSSKLLNESPELKRAIAIDGGVSRLNIAYCLVLVLCIFALQKTMRKNSIIPS